MAARKGSAGRTGAMLPKPPTERRVTNDRRAHPRYHLVLKGTGLFVKIPVDRPDGKKKMQAQSQDVSLGGMKVVFGAPVRPGDVVRLKFLLPRRGEVAFDAVVRWAVSRPRKACTAGLAFVRDVPRKAIQALLDLAAAGLPTFGEAVARQINLPLVRAVEISLRSLKIRFWRSAVTSAVVFLAIAFLVFMLSTEPVNQNLEVGEVLVKTAQSQRLWVALISMIVAVVGITNTLHMSVAERYREIGTMKCLGALDRFVVELFMLEAVAMGTIGSAIGSVLGTLMAIMPWVFRGKDLAEAVLPWAALGQNFLIGIVAGMVLTLVGSLYPAYRASRMAPAEAMRTEV